MPRDITKYRIEKGEGIRIRCCSCGLSHDFFFTDYDENKIFVIMRMQLNQRSTAQVRRINRKEYRKELRDGGLL